MTIADGHGAYSSEVLCTAKPQRKVIAMQPCLPQAYTNEWLHLLTVVAPHALIVLTTILNYRLGQKNRRDIKEVKRALNGKVDVMEE